MPFHSTVGTSCGFFHWRWFWSSHRSSGWAAGVHASMRVPPQEQLMRPIGTSRFLNRVSPKKNATALCGGIVSGVVATHLAETSSSGAAAMLCFTLKWRISGQFAAATSFSQSFTLRWALMVNSMLLCPEQNQTSPTTTSLRTISFSPLTTKAVPFALALSGARSTRHEPSAPAVAPTVCPANATVTPSPGDALPHTGTRCPLCNTML